MRLALLLAAFILANLILPASGSASGGHPRPPYIFPLPLPSYNNAAISGIKFNDINANGVFDSGEPVFSDHDVFIQNTLSGDRATLKTDAHGNYFSGKHRNGTFKVWTHIPTGWRQTTPELTDGEPYHAVALFQNRTKTLNFGIVQDDIHPTDVQDACVATPTVSSVGSGDWNNPDIWDTGVVPGPDDWVSIEPGDSVTAPNRIDLEDGGLCIRETATLRSANNNGNGFPARVEIHGASVHNSGDIIGQDGSSGKCGRYNTAGSSIQIWATCFINDIKGKIQSGNGGDDTYGCGTWTCPARGGNGGSIEVFSTTAINEGIFRSGDGGYGRGCHAYSYGGNGGDINIITDISDPDNKSKNRGFLIAGSAGDVKTQRNRGIAGKGGDFNLYLIELGGTIEGKDGSVATWDPVQLRASCDLQISGVDSVEIFTDEDGTMDLTQLDEGAISAAKTITIASGEVDLRGLSSKVFQAGEKIEIFSDHIVSDEGQAFEDLTEAPDVEVSPGKTIRRVALSAESFITGNPGDTISLSVKVMNNSAADDSYALNVSDSQGWDLGTLPSPGIEGFSSKDLILDFVLPAVWGETNTIFITAVSQTDTEAAAATEVNVSVNPGPDSDNDDIPDILDDFPDDPNEQSDSDNDGLGNNADADDDDDGIPDDEDAFPNDPMNDEDDPGSSGTGNFKAGVFTVGSAGVVQVDWLYDGGMYKGELGIFSLEGMENMEPDSEEFITEAVTRVLSHTVAGHVVLSDISQGARFNASLGERKNWNTGPYYGVNVFRMRPGDQFATILVPNATFEALAQNPGTGNFFRRPLFSLVSLNPAYGMCLGQIADINGMGTAFAYEDMNAEKSDRDYNDLIFQIFGASIDEAPDLDSLIRSDKSRRSERDGSGWSDWRTQTALGRKIMEHLDTQITDAGTEWLSASIRTDADLLLYDPDGNLIGEKGVHIPGMTFGADVDGSRFIRLPVPREGDYRLLLRGEKDEEVLLNVRKHRGENEIVSEETKTIRLEAHKTVLNEVSTASSADGLLIDVGEFENSLPYDTDGNGVIDDSDIQSISSVWNRCEGEEGYVPFFDSDGDGCITILDIISVVSASQ